MKTNLNGLPKDLQEQIKKLEKEVEESKKLPAGVVPGKLFWVPVADGHAYYRVIKVNKKTATIRWCPELDADRWQDVVLGEGGVFSIGIIDRIIKRIEGLRKIFGG